MTKKKTEETSESKLEEAVDISGFTELEREWIDEIKRLNDACTAAASAMVASKECAKSATEEYNGAVSLLRSTIRRGANKQPELPGFDAAGENWRAVPVGEALAASSRQFEKLDDCGVTTVGEFEDLRAGKNKDYPRGLLDVPGVGQATINKWEDQVLEWFAKRNPIESSQVFGAGGDDGPAINQTRKAAWELRK